MWGLEAMLEKARWTYFVSILFVLSACQPNLVSNPTATLTRTPIPTPAISVKDKPGTLYERVFTVPVGEDGVHYEGVDVPESLAWGPAGFTVGPGGDFWIADSVSQRILHYSPRGQALGVINLQGQVVGIYDVEVSRAEILVLDSSSQVPKVLCISLDGKSQKVYDLPMGLRLENGLTGIGIGEEDEVRVELEGGYKIYQLVDANGRLNPVRLDGYSLGGKLYWMGGPNGTAGDVKLETRLTHGLGGLSFLGANPDGGFYVVRDDVVNDQIIQVDRTVHYLNVNGEQLGLARMPLSEQFVYVPHGLAVGPDGAVYALITRRDAVDIVRLNFFKEMDPLLPTALEPLITTNQQSP